MDLVGFKDESVFAKDMLAREQGIARHRKVLIERNSDNDSFDFLVRQKIAMVLVFFRAAVKFACGTLDGLSIDIAQCNATACIEARQMVNEVRPATANANHPESHGIACGLDFPNRRAGNNSRAGLDCAPAGNVDRPRREIGLGHQTQV
jgi:hypothetical protein